jgi:hypothetical protein
MALKPDMSYSRSTDISQRWSEITAQNTQEKGGIACVESQGSGVALGSEENVVQYSSGPSGAVPKGILLQDINPALPANRAFKNFHNLEIWPGEPVTLLSRGWIVTDMINGTPAVGGTAYVGPSGLIGVADTGGCAVVGRFETTKNADGFAKVSITLE